MMKKLIGLIMLIGLIYFPGGTAVASTWHFDEGANTTAYDSSGGNNGTLLPAGSEPQWVQGKFGTALSFDGVNDYVDFGDIAVLNSTSQFTIEAWIKQDDNTAFQRIMGKAMDGNNDILISSFSNALYLEVGNGANTGGYWTAYAATISSGRWFHFAAVFDGSKSNAAERGKIYINGVERSMTALGAYPSATANLAGRSFYMGSAFDGHFFKGAIDELRIYNTVLSGTDISNHYYEGVTTGAISGRVQYTSNNPVRFATVSNGAQSAFTDVNGNYIISNVPPGTYTVTVSKPGYQSAPQSGVVVTRGGITSVNAFVLTVTVPDVTQPSPVTNLATTNMAANSMVLTWTSPGDDGTTDVAAQYDIRYSTAPITAGTFSTANQCSKEPAPKPAGGPEAFTVTDLAPNTTYYFALKTADESGNWSGISNIPSGITTGLSLNTTYYWRVVAVDNHGASTVGPISSFTTMTEDEWLRYKGLLGTAAITFDSGHALTRLDSISFAGTEHGGTNSDIKLRIKTASTEAELASAATTTLGAGNTATSFVAGTDFTVAAGRWIQVQAELRTTDKVTYPPKLDDLTLSYTPREAPASGTATFTFDAGHARTEWQSIVWSAATTTGEDGVNSDIKARVRTADTEANLSSAAWSVYYGANTDNEGTPLSISPPANRYMQIETTLYSVDPYNYPTRLEDLTVNYTPKDAPGSGTATITFDSGAITRWDSLSFSGTEDVTNTDIKLRVRSALTIASLATATWSGYKGAGSNTPQSFTLTTTDAPNNRYLQIEATLTSNGSVSNITALNDVTLTYTPVGPLPNVVAYWNLDGNANDSSGEGHNGTLYGTPAWVAGKATAFGQALSFDGVNDYVDFGDIADLNSTSKFTIEAWMKQNNNTLLQRIMGKTIDGNNDILISSFSNRLYFEVGNNANTGGYWAGYAASIPSGQWFHFAAVFDGTQTNAVDRIKIYVNGVAQPMTAMVGTYPSATANLAGNSFYIGKAFDTNYFAGAIDELRIYKVALSGPEIATHATATAPF